MHPAGLEPATCNLEGCCSNPTELRMLTIGLEPILPKGTDFKSVVFTDFTKRAASHMIKNDKTITTFSPKNFRNIDLKFFDDN